MAQRVTERYGWNNSNETTYPNNAQGGIKYSYDNTTSFA